MRRGFSVLLFLLGALPLSALAQVNVTRIDHDWVIRYRTNTFGLQQTTFGSVFDRKAQNTFTVIYLGSRQMTLHTSVWPIVLGATVGFTGIISLLIYGVGSLTRPAKKHPPPKPSPTA